MSSFEIYTSHSTVFGGFENLVEKADYVILGVPFDSTSTYRTGARFAPSAIREASLNIETYSFRSNLDLEDLKIHDLGDLHISHKAEISLKRLEACVDDLLKAEKTPVLIGGEHTITLGSMCGVGGEDTAVISLDAHLDLRNEYMGLTTSHTTFMRRLNEQVKPARIVEAGVRAVCREELDYAKQQGIIYLTPEHMRRIGLVATAKAIKDFVRNCKRIYLSIDMDVLDPAFAPAVQNPEPDGLSIQEVLDLLLNCCDSRVVGLDLVEVAPPYDMGVTAVQAAKILSEALCRIEKARET